MIQATARVLQNVIELRLEREEWMCRPVVSATGAITRRIASLFATTYETYRSTDPNAVHSTVSYSAKKDEILVQLGELKWRTKSSLFGPMTFEYGGVDYQINEKLTGRFAILTGSRVVATGELGFRSCVIRDAPPELEGFFANLALGYLIRTLVWEMFR
ncbi:MAG: hypothetical protein L3K06_06845 [Thermoplasmata archaeon]|nr:hypothetical protein [Thermoplasmata archaeon]